MTFDQSLAADVRKCKLSHAWREESHEDTFYFYHTRSITFLSTTYYTLDVWITIYLLSLLSIVFVYCKIFISDLFWSFYIFAYQPVY